MKGGQALRLLSWLLLPTLAALLLTLIADHWKADTRVELELVTSRLAITVGGEAPREVLAGGARFASLVVTNCDTFTFRPKNLGIADSDADGETAWRELPVDETAVVRCLDPTSKLILHHIESARSADAPLGLLDPFRLDPGARLTFAVHRGAGETVDVTLDVEGFPTAGEPLTLLLETGEFEIFADNAPLESASVPVDADLLTYRAELSADAPLAEIIPRSNRLTFVLTPPTGSSPAFLGDQPRLDLTHVELLDETLGGEARSPLLSGSLSYPKYPKVPAKNMDPADFLALRDFGTFRLEHLSLDHDRTAFKLRVDGEVGKALSGDDVDAVDARLSLLDRFRFSSRLNLYAAVVVWALSTTWVAYERWRKLSDKEN